MLFICATWFTRLGSTRRQHSGETALAQSVRAILGRRDNVHSATTGRQWRRRRPLIRARLDLDVGWWRRPSGPGLHIARAKKAEHNGAEQIDEGWYGEHSVPTGFVLNARALNSDIKFN